MTSLKLGEYYTKKQVKEFFEDKNGKIEEFKAGTGTWGMLGMINNFGSKRDWVFFVTLDQKQANHHFQEGLTEDGLLVWQSQPKLSFLSPEIVSLINFDSSKDNIYLFLTNPKDKSFLNELYEDRKDSKYKYLYLGKLAYHTHDEEKQNPVHFNWKLLDWGVLKDKISNKIGFIENGLINQTTINEINPLVAIKTLEAKNDSLINELKKIREKRSPNFINQDLTKIRESQIETGKLAETYVLKLEKEYLIKSNRPDLAEKVHHIANEGDGAGYDIKSYDINGSEKFIEVKGTTGKLEDAFFMSSNEIAFAKKNYDANEQYCLYRVYEIDKKKAAYKLKSYSAKDLLLGLDLETLYEKADSEKFSFETTQFRVKLK